MREPFFEEAFRLLESRKGDGFFETNLHPVKSYNKDLFPERDASEEDIYDRLRASMNNIAASNTSIIECSRSGERELHNFEDGRNASAQRNRLPLPRKRISISAEQGDSMQENLAKVESSAERADRLKRLHIETGSVEELMDVIVASDGVQDISSLCSVLPNVYCFHMAKHVPLAMAPSLTPRRTRNLTFEGHAICQVDCGFGCEDACAANTDTFVQTIQAFKIEENPTIVS